MRDQKNRLKTWGLLLIILAAVVIYFYYDRQNNSLIHQLTQSSIEPSALLYLKSDNKEQVLMKHDLKNGQDGSFLSLGSRELLSIYYDTDKNGFFALIKDGSQYKLLSIDADGGNEKELIDLSILKPSKLFKYGGQYIIITGDKKNTLTIVDSTGEAGDTFELSNEITTVFPVSAKNIQVATFDGSRSEIKLYNLEGEADKDIIDVDGRVYQFDQNKVLYARKVVQTEDSSNNPVENTHWKVAIKGIVDASDTILSDGNFDQSPIMSNNYKQFAYQKKYDTDDKDDGRIFLIMSENQTDRIATGIPLIYLY